jgi:DNA-binding transcriptional LysR family regulator
VGRRIEITSEGRAFSAKATEILRKAEELERQFGQALAANCREHLAVGGTHFLSASILAPILTTFKTRYVNVEIELITKSGPFIERLVLGGKVDVGMVVSVGSPSLLIVEPFRYEEMVVIVSKQHALSKKQKLTMAELAQAPLIVRTRKNCTSNQILGEVVQHGFELNVLMKSDSAQGVKVAVAQGVGVGLLYRSHVEQEIRKGELKVLNVPGLKKHIQSFIIYKAERPLSPAAQEFLELLRQFRDNKTIKSKDRLSGTRSGSENRGEGESVGDQE